MDNTIADRLKEARNKAGMHQEDAARSMEMSRPTLSAIESGKRVVSAEEIREFSALYDVSSNWLLYGDNSEEEARMKRLGKYYQLYSKADGEDYLVGSVLIFQRSGNVLKAIPDDEIGDLLEVAMRAAKPRLIHIEMNLLNNFKRLGVQASTLNGAEHLELIHQQFHMGDDEKFFFDWKWLV